MPGKRALNGASRAYVGFWFHCSPNPVQAALTGVRILRPDVTQTDPSSRELLNRYQVMGPPTLLFIGPDGEERRIQRITGEVDAIQFLSRWNETMERG